MHGTLAAFALLLASAVLTFGQTTLQFTAIAQTDEQAIRLVWASQSNHIYQVQCSDNLAGNPDGTTAWQILYDDYPSQGTNTWSADFGNYLKVPPILHPKKMPMRYYRIADTGADDLPTNNMAISILAPANDYVASGELTITVAVTNFQASLSTKLYVDGQEMWPSRDGANYFINTSEWGNGPHVLFATAECLDHTDGSVGAPASQVGHAVSPFVPVTFSNLVTRIGFSEWFFQPALGQTQQVSAVFAANSDWTLQIKDVYTNTVRTATGSGTSMLFSWDGTGDGGTNIPDGVYYYYISAQTNGQAFQALSGSGSISSSVFASSPESSDSTELWAVPADGSGAAVPFAMYPLGIDTNHLTFFEAPSGWLRARSALSLSASSFSGIDSGGSTPSSAYSGASSQSADPAPERPPNDPVRNQAGTFGVAYQTYLGNGTNGIKAGKVSNGAFQGYVQILGASSSSAPITWRPLRTSERAGIDFASRMQNGGWGLSYIRDNDRLPISDLKGSSTPFNDVNLGLLILHGAYGTSDDVIANKTIRQMYFPIASGASATYLRLSEMNLGGAGTNGLKWMALMACNSLYGANWTTMQDQGIHPYNNNLRLLLGAETAFTIEPQVAEFWADDMLGDPSKGRAPITIEAAWYDAFTRSYKVTNAFFVPVNPTKVSVAGDTACFLDYLKDRTNTVMSGTWTIHSPHQVYPQ
jgi:hypothetical protein